jgi:hypothetical protein
VPYYILRCKATGKSTDPFYAQRENLPALIASAERKLGASVRPEVYEPRPQPLARRTIVQHKSAAFVRKEG